MFKIPSFDDFLADVGEEKMIKWYMTVDGIKLCDSFPKTAEDIQQMASVLLSASHDITLAMMRDYHEWLVQQLSAKSVHLVK